MIILCELKSAMLELEPLVPDPTSWDSFFLFFRMALIPTWTKEPL
jgi:hypothetical protein